MRRSARWLVKASRVMTLKGTLNNLIGMAASVAVPDKVSTLCTRTS